jgi:electron transfer flavoprotein beta subunit
MQIAHYAKENNFDLVLTGKETINYNGSQVGGMLAEALDLPFISLATKLDVTNNVARMEREIVGGVQVVEAALPLVVSCAKGMAEQRIPNMRGIMAARTKPLTVIPAVATDELTTYVEYGLPSAKSAVKMIDPSNMDELVALLHNEAKVI